MDNNAQHDTIIIRYSEIGLKGKNRIDFENRLINNIRTCLKNADIPFSSIKRPYGRIMIKTQRRCNILKKVFGITSFSHASEVQQDKDIITEKAVALAKDILDKDTFFRASVQRVDKSFPIRSNELAALIGEKIIEKTGAPVSLKNPDITVHAELIDGKAYIFTDKIQGYGGLPIDPHSRTISLLSSGIDSPVASWMMMKRGCSMIFVFNDNTPYAPTGEKANAIEQFQNLKAYDPSARLYIVPFGKMQEMVKDIIRPRFRCIFCKRLMYLAAEEIARKEDIKAIVTGESIGQVASQTLDNLAVLDSITTLPVLRPVIGMNKQEIIDIARDIGTYRTSSLTKGGCSFLPQCPATRAKPQTIEKEDKHLENKLGDIRNIIKNIIKEAEIIE